MLDLGKDRRHVALQFTSTRRQQVKGEQAFAAGKPAIVDVRTHLEGIAPKAWMPI